MSKLISFARDKKTVASEYDGSHEISVCVYGSFVVATILFVKCFGISFLIIARNSVLECGEQTCATNGMVPRTAFIHS
uniref:Uncharacterized protein n=1 Tax=Romanomermis culicivorax TaxID=13658 RepID=A0A915JAQ2_ROMCU